MIVLIGPDGTGKTTLAHRLENAGLKYYHYSNKDGYIGYINPLCKLEYTNAVLDRYGYFCEYVYSTVMNRPIQFDIRQMHNLATMLLIQKPVIVLCTHKPRQSEYAVDQYLPYEKWEKCLSLYRELLITNKIDFTEYDYAEHQPIDAFVESLLDFSSLDNSITLWWRRHWLAGYGCAGSATPDYLLVAERIGPNNTHNIPFETGPTGSMLSNMIVATHTPLGKLAITNMVKSFRRDTRAVNDRDIELLDEEITHLHPKKVIFMGSAAKRGIPVAKAHGCETDTMVHLGSFNYKGVSDMTGYHTEWAKMLGLVQAKKFV